MSTSQVEGAARLAQNTNSAHAVAMARLALYPIDWIAAKHTIAVIVKSKGKLNANRFGEVCCAVFIGRTPRQTQDGLLQLYLCLPIRGESGALQWENCEKSRLLNPPV